MVKRFLFLPILSITGLIVHPFLKFPGKALGENSLSDQAYHGQAILTRQHGFGGVFSDVLRGCAFMGGCQVLQLRMDQSLLY